MRILSGRCTTVGAVIVAVAVALSSCEKRVEPEVLVQYGRGIAIMNIYLEGDYIYHVDHPVVPTLTMARIFRIPKNGGESVTIVSNQDMYSIAMDQDHYYWANFGNYSGIPHPAAIMRMSRHGGEPEVLYQDRLVRPFFIVTSEEFVYWTEGQGPSKVLGQQKEGSSFFVLANTRKTGFLSMHDGYLYYSDVGDLWRMAIDDGTQELVVEGLVDIWSWEHSLDDIILTDCGGGGCGVYMGATGKIHRYSLSNGDLKTIASGLDEVFGVAADDNYVYATMHIKLGGSVIYLSRDGGPVGVLADGLDAPNSIVVDDDYVYWSTLGLYDGSAIMRLAKPRSPP